MALIDRNSTRPLQIQIQDYILGLILKGELKPGGSLQSEHELADQLGVSRLTVRKAYTELVKKGTLYTVQGKGTFVVESLVKEQIGKPDREAKPANRMIGILFPEITMYFGPIVKEIEMRAAEDGYTISVMFNESEERERYALEQMLAQNVSGIILTPIWQKRIGHVNENYEKLMRSTMPFVMIGDPPFHVLCDATYVDEAVAIYDIVQALQSMGHEKFLFLYDSYNTHPHALIARSEGFRLAARMLLDTNKPLMIDVFRKNWKEDFREQILADQPVTAVITAGDQVAVIAYNAIYDFGKQIPSDVSVVGYDNTYICENLQVKLSSVAHNSKLLGQTAYDLLKTQITHGVNVANNGNMTHRIVLKPELIMRESVGQRATR